MDRYLRPLRRNIFQVVINDRVVAVLRRLSTTSIEVWTLADVPSLLVTLMDSTPMALTPARVAQRLAEGEFDNDFRFEIDRNPEPDSPSDLYTVAEIATPSQKVIDVFHTDRPYDVVETAREVQAIPLEERWALYAERGW